MFSGFQKLDRGLVHEVSQVNLLSQGRGAFPHVDAHVDEHRKNLTLPKSTLFSQTFPKVLLHIIAWRVIVKPFQNLGIFGHIRHKAITGPQTQPLNGPTMPCHLQIPKPPTTFPQPYHTLQDQMMTDIQQRRRKGNDLPIVQQSFVEFTEQHQSRVPVNDPWPDCLVCKDRTLMRWIGQGFELFAHWCVADSEVQGFFQVQKG